MIHILRKNETIEDLENIYNIESGEIKKANFFGEPCPYENSALWIPLENKIYFSKKEESLKSICESNHIDIKTVKKLNQIDFDKLPANVRIIFPNADNMKFELSSIHKVTSSETSFVPVDMNGKYISKVWIDGYDLFENNLNLPYDYPAIQASLINKVEPCFALSDLHRYADDNIINQLIHDLSFKEYEGGLIIIHSENEINDALKIAQNLINEKYDISIAATVKILKAIGDFSRFKNIYYISDKNIFDFESFTDHILSLKDLIPPNKLGLIYKKGFADINKNKMQIEYIHSQDVENILNTEKNPYVTFDDRSQLCFMTYYHDGDQHNVVFEDIRSFYAKADFLLKNNITNIIIDQTDKELMKYYGILKDLSFED